MSLSPAAVSLERSRDPAGPRVLIAGRGVARLETVLALRALAGDRLEITIPAPDLKFINGSFSVAQPFNPQRVGDFRLKDAAPALGAWWDRRILDRFEREGHRTRLETVASVSGTQDERDSQRGVGRRRVRRQRPAS